MLQSHIASHPASRLILSQSPPSRSNTDQHARSYHFRGLSINAVHWPFKRSISEPYRRRRCQCHVGYQIPFETPHPLTFLRNFPVDGSNPPVVLRIRSARLPVPPIEIDILQSIIEALADIAEEDQTRIVPSPALLTWQWGQYELVLGNIESSPQYTFKIAAYALRGIGEYMNEFLDFAPNLVQVAIQGRVVGILGFQRPDQAVAFSGSASKVSSAVKVSGTHAIATS